MGKPKAKKAAPTTSAYTPTDREKSALAEFHRRKEAAIPLPKLRLEKLADGGVATVGIIHDDLMTAAGLQMAAFGLTYVAECDEFLKAAANVCAKNGEIDMREYNALLAMVAGMKPTNSIEAMLTLQMAAVHQATMRLAAALRGSAELETLQWRSKTLNNLSRTFGVHAETLQKLRSKPGQQKVTVEHRHYHLAPGAIAPGSQAVLGDVSGGGGKSQIEGQSDERDWMLLPERAAVHGAIEANGHEMPGTGVAWQEGMPVSRRPGRSA